jgi:hypothetical protein
LDIIIRELAGPPYHISPFEVLKKWTLPQVLFTFIGKQEHLAADARQQFSLTMAAIGSVFSKDGKRLAKKVFDSLEIGGPPTMEDTLDSLSDSQIKILYGADALEAWKKKRS